jgi:hypothetical protein
MVAEKVLRWLLRVSGVVILLAVIPVFAPTAWLAGWHEKLGLGPLPEGAIVEYLMRSLSAFYAMYGGLILVLSVDPRRYAGAIAYTALASIAFGLTMIWIDRRVGLPLAWILSEGPFIVLTGIVILILQARIRSKARLGPQVSLSMEPCGRQPAASSSRKGIPE